MAVPRPHDRADLRQSGLRSRARRWPLRQHARVQNMDRHLQVHDSYRLMSKTCGTTAWRSWRARWRRRHNLTVRKIRDSYRFPVARRPALPILP